MRDDEEDRAFLRHLESMGVPSLPSEHQRVGLDRNTEEGALIAFSGSLRRTNRSHRVIAWVLLVAFGLPALVTLLWVLGLSVRWLWDA